MADKSDLIWRVLIALGAALAVGDVIIHRHAYFAIEALPMFFVIYGLVCLGLAMGGSRLLAALVTREPDYYDADREEGDADV